MTKNMIEKNIKLSLDFDRYVSRNPSALRFLPQGANIIFVHSKDKALSEANRDIARNSKSGKFYEAAKKDGAWRVSAFKK